MMAWVPLLFIVVATVFDLKTREVPDAIPASLLVWAVVATAFRLHPVGWGSMLGGLAIAFALGLLVFGLGGLGGGDVKVLAALGAALGHAAILPALFWIALAGAFLAVVAVLRKQRDLAYLPAIALGLLIFLLWQGRAGHAHLS